MGGARVNQMPSAHRATIFLEDAAVVLNDAFPGDQHVVRVQAPRIAETATPGSFVHVRCDEDLRLRRPMSVMRADPDAGWLDMLFKVVGDGTARLAKKGVGSTLSLLGPIGKPFTPHPDRPLALLIGGGVGIPPLIFLAEVLRRHNVHRPLVLMGSEVPFPFTPRPSRILVSGLPAGAIAAMPLLDDWGVPSRLASQQRYAGCYDGFVTDLARAWLRSLEPPDVAGVELFACGPTPMLKAVAAVAREFELPAQLSLEEFMACGVGGCAGCTVLVRTPSGPAMRRVCVDGPVFEAQSVYPAESGDS